MESHDVDIIRNKHSSALLLVCYTAVFRVVSQRPSPQRNDPPSPSGEERCVTTPKTAV